VRRGALYPSLGLADSPAPGQLRQDRFQMLDLGAYLLHPNLRALTRELQQLLPQHQFVSLRNLSLMFVGIVRS
jgi:hypothetical protein